ncbi:MAG TPA: L,D-transpeptidase family protein [Syntrophales bacterium]|nr:L,D-transpeptidase family protein [Syntrophales bacterium]
MRISLHLPVSLMIISSIFLFVACAALRDNWHGQRIDFQGLPANMIGESSQIILVRNTNPAVVDVQVLALEKKNDRWQSPFAPMEGVIGRNGFAPPGEKREGDGRTPSGIFPLGTVFGYEPSFPTRMPYQQAVDDDVWVDDVNAADYNKWVKKGSTNASSFERMRRDDDLYKYGIVVEYNTNPVIKGSGSAIFFHLWKGPGQPTEGCLALSEENLIRVIQWLDPTERPLVIMGTKEMIDRYGR